MFNIGTGEIIVIAVVALLVLGPKRLPELARGIGKFMREFRRQTDEVRGVVEREFYKMDQEINAAAPVPPVVPQPAPGLVAVDGPKPGDDPQPPPTPALTPGQEPAPAPVPVPLAENTNGAQAPLPMTEHHDGLEPPPGAVPEPLGEKKAG
jgi:sec-independent protein translocase protein TatB